MRCVPGMLNGAMQLMDNKKRTANTSAVAPVLVRPTCFIMLSYFVHNIAKVISSKYFYVSTDN